MSEQTLDTILENHSIYIRMPEIKEKGSTPLLRPKDAKQAFVVFLTQKRQRLEEKQDITKYQLLPETYQLIESRKKFIDELVEEIK